MKKSVMKYYPTFFLMILFASCSNGVGPELGVEPEPASDELLIVNHTDAIIHYTAFEQEALASINWVPNTNPDAPNRIHPGRRQLLKLDEIFEYAAGDTFVLYWWVPVKSSREAYKVTRFSFMVVDSGKISSSYRYFWFYGAIAGLYILH
jgi:hypothetical protein